MFRFDSFKRGVVLGDAKAWSEQFAWDGFQEDVASNVGFANMQDGQWRTVDAKGFVFMANRSPPKDPAKALFVVSKYAEVLTEAGKRVNLPKSLLFEKSINGKVMTVLMIPSVYQMHEGPFSYNVVAFLAKEARGPTWLVSLDREKFPGATEFECVNFETIHPGPMKAFNPNISVNSDDDVLSVHMRMKYNGEEGLRQAAERMDLLLGEQWFKASKEQIDDSPDFQEVYALQERMVELQNQLFDKAVEKEVQNAKTKTNEKETDEMSEKTSDFTKNPPPYVAEGVQLKDFEGFPVDDGHSTLMVPGFHTVRDPKDILEFKGVPVDKGPKRKSIRIEDENDPWFIMSLQGRKVARDRQKKGTF